MKKILAFFLSLLLCSSAITVATAENIMTYTKTETILKGLTRTDVQVYDTGHNLSYHYIVADLSEPHLNFELLKSDKGVDQLETLSALAATTPNIVTAINADFFSASGAGLGFSLGLEILDGELLQTPIEPDKMATALLSDDEVLTFSYLEYTRTLEKEDGSILPIRHTNKHTTWYADILLYTSDFNNGNSPAPGGTTVEIVVEDDVITDIRRGDVSIAIPENGYVLLTDESMNPNLSDLQIGDTLTIHTTASPSLDNAVIGFGGGTILVKDGKISDFTHSVSGYNPRSAIGTDITGTKVYFVTVDGRQEKSRGMTQTELANLMIQLGCYQAINLDGGGSTRLLAASASSDSLTIANSPTENRKVINGIGISSSAKRTAPVRMEISAPQNRILLGDTISLNSFIYDKLDHILTDITDVSWNLDGVDGTYKSNRFTPRSPGVAQISASTGNITSNAVSIEVIDQISGIKLPDSISIDVGKSIMPKIEVFDHKNQSIQVQTLQPFDLQYDSSFIKIENGKLVGVQDGTSKLSLSYGDVTTTISVTVGTGGEKLRLEQNSYKDEMVSQKDSGFVFRVGAFNDETTCLDILTGNGMEELLSEGDKVALLGAPMSRTANGKRINANSFRKTESNNCLFISLDISDGSLKKSDSAQWSQLLSALNDSSAPNIFLLFNDSFDEWNNQSEQQVLMDFLASKSSERNFFVISPGNRNTLSASGGVRYFTLSDSSKGADAYDGVTSLHALSFSVNDDHVTYRWIPFYEK